MRGLYVGPDLEKLFSERAVKRALRDVADDAGDYMHDTAVRNTPIVTGNLRSGWYREPTRVEHAGTEDVYTSRVANDVSYAADVNYGTGLYGPEHRKYLIESKTPGRMLSWIDPVSGKRVFRRRVMHPGSRGQFMAEAAGARTEGFFGEIAAEPLARMGREMEAEMRAVAKVLY